MARKLKDAVDERAAEIAEAESEADDFRTLLSALPPGQVKNLLKDEVCGVILAKYGITGE